MLTSHSFSGIPNRIRIANLGMRPGSIERWSIDDLLELLSMGFNALQISAADDGVSLTIEHNMTELSPGSETLDSLFQDNDGRFAMELRTLKLRSALAKSVGFRTICQIELPLGGTAAANGELSTLCMLDPHVISRLEAALKAFADSAVGIDDLLLGAIISPDWLTDEFSGCERCFGIPLHRRLPVFINQIARAWGAKRPGGRVWWAPQGLSNGQMIGSIRRLEPNFLGLVLRPVVDGVTPLSPKNVFFVNAAREGSQRGLPVIAQVPLGSTNHQVDPWEFLASPLVTLHQLRDVESTFGVAGVVEQFGVRPFAFDPNLATARAYFADPIITDRDALRLACTTLGVADEWMQEFWTRCSSAYMLYPWDVASSKGNVARRQVAHDLLTMATIPEPYGESIPLTSPRFDGTSSAFVRSRERLADFIRLEDIELRLASASRAMESAVTFFRAHFLDRGDQVSRNELAQLSESIAFVTRCNSQEYHLRASHLAALIRSTRASEERREHLLAELAAVLDLDLRNQQRELNRRRQFPAVNVPLPSASDSDSDRCKGGIAEEATSTEDIHKAIDLLESNSEAFLARYFLPTGERSDKFEFKSEVS